MVSKTSISDNVARSKWTPVFLLEAVGQTIVGPIVGRLPFPLEGGVRERPSSTADSTMSVKACTKGTVTCSICSEAPETFPGGWGR